MARLSMNEMTTYRWAFETDVQRYAEAGVDAIGVWRQKLSDFGEEKGVELLEESPLDVSCLMWAGGFTGSDGRTYRDSVADAIEAVHLARDLQAASLVVYSGGRAGHTHNHARRLFRSALKDVCAVAQQESVTLAIEPMHPGCAAEWTFLTCLEETLETIAAVESPNLKMVFDAYHLGFDPAVVSRIPEILPLVSLVQLGDGRQPPNGEPNRCRLGDGCIPLREIVDALIAAGYDGVFDIELMGEDLECLDYADLIHDSMAQFRRYTVPA